MDDGNMMNMPDAAAELKEDIKQEDFENENFQEEELHDNDDLEGENDDEDDYTFGTNLKYMKSCEMKKLLLMKIPLLDGSRAPLFSRGPKYADKCWPVNCHLCLQGNLLGVKSVRSHLTGRTHKQLLRRRRREPIFYWRAYRQSSCGNPEITTPLRIFPGEIITDVIPKYQHRIIRKDDFKILLAADEMLNFPDPVADYNGTPVLFGLSYAYKMLRSGHLVYLCVLCDKFIHGEAHQHFLGRSHIDKYAEIHFPNTLNRIKTISKGNLEWESYMEAKTIKYLRAIIQLIYAKIEKQYGKQDVELIDPYDFKINQAKYKKTALNAAHYNENTIAITDEELKDYIIEVSASFSLKLKLKGEKVEKLPKMKSLRKDLKAQENQDKGIESRSEPRKKPVRELRPRVRHNSKELLDSPDVLDRYSRMIGATMDDLEDQYEGYENDPESHPHYTKEWKKYWHSRADELEKDNIDPHTYDFNSEWMPYWIKRLQELHAKDIVNHKFDIKKKLNMSYDTRSPSPVRRKKHPRLPSPRRSHTPHKKLRTDTDAMSYQSSDDEKLSVISVLRLLTALEDQLGSLGPQAIQLLSRAIIANKNNSNSNDLLMENDFYIFLITAREKFKGQLLAKIVDSPKIHAVNQAVEQITAIVEMFEENKAQNSNNVLQNERRGGVYGANNQYTFSTSSFNNEHPNKNKGNQGGVWQSGAYRRSGYNSGPNVTSATGTNYRGDNNRTNNQASNHQMDNVESYPNRAFGANEHLIGSAQVGFRQMDESNGNVFPPNNASLQNRNYSNNNSLMTFGGGPNRMTGQMNNSAGKSFNQGYNKTGRNRVNVSPSQAYQMGNSACLNLGSGMGGGQMNTGYNLTNNFNNNFEGQAPDVKWGENRSSFYSGDNNCGSRMNAHGNSGFGQSSMGNTFNSRVNQMNFQNNRNSM